MFTLRAVSWLVAAAFAATAFGGLSAAPPKIARPRPAPESMVPNVPPLPDAEVDNALAIGGDTVKAQKESSRLSVDVRINGRGPYKFIVDSGADTSAVGLRIAKKSRASARHAGDPQRHDRRATWSTGCGWRNCRSVQARSATSSCRR